MSGAFWTAPARVISYRFWLVVWKLGNILHLTRNDTHAFLPAKNEVGCTTDATWVGLVDLGLEAMFFWHAISMNSKGCLLSTPYESLQTGVHSAPLWTCWYVCMHIYIHTQEPQFKQTVTPNRNSHNLFQPSWKSSHCAPCSGLPAGRLLRRRRFLQQLLLHPSSCFVGVLRLRICDFIDQLIYQIITYCWDKLIYSNWYKFVQ